MHVRLDLMTAVLVTLASVVGVLLALLLAEVVRGRAPARLVVAAAGDAGSDAGPHPAVLVFLTSTCTTCHDLWAKLADADVDRPAGARVVVVTKGEEAEDRRRVARLAPRGVDVRMSTEVWEHYGVTAAPYVVRTAASGTAVASGVVRDWADVLAIGRAGADLS
jgi:hypothetical protein